ncbi:hypothetical protein M3Y99_01360000 [Aphelenchoides fujianensis]|nr:hypothetical protein M3Y99_01360000 [Aphelenchoides fujianensis]
MTIAVALRFAPDPTPDGAVREMRQTLARVLVEADGRAIERLGRQVDAWIRAREASGETAGGGELLVNEVLVPLCATPAAHALAVRAWERLLGARLAIDWRQVVVPRVLDAVRAVRSSEPLAVQSGLVRRLLADGVFATPTELLVAFVGFRPGETLRREPLAFFLPQPPADPEIFETPRFMREVAAVFRAIGADKTGHAATVLARALRPKFPWIPRRVVRCVLFDHVDREFGGAELEGCRTAFRLLDVLHADFFTLQAAGKTRFDDRLAFLFFLDEIVRRQVDSPTLAACGLRADGVTAMRPRAKTVHFLLVLLERTLHFVKKQFGTPEAIWQKAVDLFAEFETTGDATKMRSTRRNAAVGCAFVRRLFATAELFANTEGRAGVDAKLHADFAKAAAALDAAFERLDDAAARCDEGLARVTGAEFERIAQRRRAHCRFPPQLLQSGDTPDVKEFHRSTAVVDAELPPTDVKKTGNWRPPKKNDTEAFFAEFNALPDFEAEDAARPRDFPPPPIKKYFEFGPPK